MEKSHDKLWALITSDAGTRHIGVITEYHCASGYKHTFEDLLLDMGLGPVVVTLSPAYDYAVPMQAVQTPPQPPSQQPGIGYIKNTICNLPEACVEKCTVHVRVCNIHFFNEMLGNDRLTMEKIVGDAEAQADHTSMARSGLTRANVLPKGALDLKGGRR